MRPIVIGQIIDGPAGLRQVNFWGRITVPAQRVAFYAALQANAAPQAPGDYSSADAQEVTDFKEGKFVERIMYDVLDPTLDETEALARLVRLVQGASTAVTSADDASLSFWGSYYNGTAWTDKSA